MQQHHRNRLANDGAAADDHRTFAGKANAIMIQDANAGFRRAGRISLAAVNKHRGRRSIRDTIHILIGTQGIPDPVIIDMGRQRPQNQNTVNGFCRIEMLNVLN